MEEHERDDELLRKLDELAKKIDELREIERMRLACTYVRCMRDNPRIPRNAIYLRFINPDL